MCVCVRCVCVGVCLVVYVGVKNKPITSTTRLLCPLPKYYGNQ